MEDNGRVKGEFIGHVVSTWGTMRPLLLRSFKIDDKSEVSMIWRLIDQYYLA